jgi:hypothetical protein
VCGDGAVALLPSGSPAPDEVEEAGFAAVMIGAALAGAGVVARTRTCRIVQTPAR